MENEDNEDREEPDFDVEESIAARDAAERGITSPRRNSSKPFGRRSRLASKSPCTLQSGLARIRGAQKNPRAALTTNGGSLP